MQGCSLNHTHTLTQSVCLSVYQCSRMSARASVTTAPWVLSSKLTTDRTMVTSPLHSRPILTPQPSNLRIANPNPHPDLDPSNFDISNPHHIAYTPPSGKWCAAWEDGRKTSGTSEEVDLFARSSCPNVLMYLTSPCRHALNLNPLPHPLAISHALSCHPSLT